MIRDCYQKLLAWKEAADRKPLVLRGARQVGKTHLLKKFAENEYENSLYLYERKTRLDFLNTLKIKTIFLDTYHDCAKSARPVF